MVIKEKCRNQNCREKCCYLSRRVVFRGQVKRWSSFGVSDGAWGTFYLDALLAIRGFTKEERHKLPLSAVARKGDGFQRLKINSFIWY
jgi:hypothetical protein